LGDSFGESMKEVVVPATFSKQDGFVKIATKKFVRKKPRCTGTPQLKLKIYEKLVGTPKAITASIIKMEEVVLTDQNQVTDHNLVKMRAALNMITWQISEAAKPKHVEEVRVWYKLIQKKFAKMNLDNKSMPEPIQSRKKAVESGINICKEVFEKAKEKSTKNKKSKREQDMKIKSISTTFRLLSMQSIQSSAKSRSETNQWIDKNSRRSELQEMSRTSDFY